MSSTFEGSDIILNQLVMKKIPYKKGCYLKPSIDKLKVADKQWDYFTAGVVVLGDIIHKSVPNGLEKYANTNVFQPLGITKYKWQFTHKK
jgi:CubicO group peptidase (beta-lactamase class C family)